MPIFVDAAGDFIAPTPVLIAEVASYVGEHRSSDSPYDITVAAMAHGKAAMDVAAFAGAGATWWLEQWHPDDLDHDAWLDRVRGGPPA